MNRVRCFECADELPELPDSLILLSGLEDALLGVAIGHGRSEVAVYDYHKVIKLIMAEFDDCSLSEAEQWFEYNVLGAWVGEQTPLFLKGIRLCHVRALMRG